MSAPTYRVEYADGRQPTPAHSELSWAEAMALLRQEWPDLATIREAHRTLVWATQADKDGPTGEGDPGTYAVATIEEEA